MNVENENFIQEILDAYAKGQIKEAFGVGTAATIVPIIGIGIKMTIWNYLRCRT